MRFSKLAFGLAILLMGGLIPVARAAEGVSASELQAAAGILVPSGSSFGILDGYSEFYLESKTAVSGGISAVYEAYLSEDPWLTDELPRLQLSVYAYSSQSAAEAELEGLTSSASGVLSKSSHDLFYKSEGGNNVDSFATVNAEYLSFHTLHRSGNLIFQASLFREDGVFNEENLKTYAEAITETSKVESILKSSVDSMKVMLGVLFPPTDADYNLSSESYSLSLDGTYALPSHGTLSMEVYISEPEGAIGTLLDSAGTSTAEAGDLYLYTNEDGQLFAGIYAPAFDANCDQQSGWYRIESGKTLVPYEWNSVALHFGVGGFAVDLNGTEVGICSVSQARSARPLYLGDFPDDSLFESMLGYVNNFAAEFSLTDTGRVWDTVLTEQLFLDLPNTDPDLRIFEYLKEKNIFMGSDGMLYPDVTLNRAEMVKTLLKTYKKTLFIGLPIPFWDVPSDAWYLKYLSTGYEIGMLEGHEDGSFLPGHGINRAEFFTMLRRLDGERYNYEDEFLDVDADDWFADAAAWASAKGLVTNLFFYPEDVLTRREAAQFLYDLLQ